MIKSLKTILFILVFFVAGVSLVNAGSSADSIVVNVTTPTTYTVTASASTGGTITPTSQSVVSGGTTTFTVTANTGYTIGSATGVGCTATRSGSTVTVGPVTANCSVNVGFTPNANTISGVVSGTGCTISPTTITVYSGSTTTFTVTPNTGYGATASGCGGSLSGTTYTTGVITSACTVTAVCSPLNYTVFGTAGTGGTISPTNPVNVNYGQTTTFTVTPNTGYSIASVSGCSGSLSGSTYTTGAIYASCTVSATFAATSAVPTLASPTATSITTTGATLGANLTSLGLPAAISARGTCWGTAPGPTTNCVATSGTTTGVFTQTRTGLSPNTTYYYRGYATNATGTGYSPSESFTTTALIPELTASSPTPSSASLNTATTFSSTITNSGNTSTGASFSNFFQVSDKVDGTGIITDKTSTTMTALASGGTGVATVSHTFTSAGIYSIRACADKSSSSSTGVITESNESNNCSAWVNVTVAASLPTVVTITPVTSITQTTATGGGNITSNGGSTILTSGCAWSTSSNPVYDSAQGPISGNIGQVTNGSLSGSYSCSLTGLTTSTTYYVRAFARNAVGTSYGSNVTFSTTGPTSGTLTATPCTITSGDSCSTTLNWSTTNPVGTSTIRTPLVSSTPIYTANSGTNQNYTYTVSGAPSTRTFFLVNNGVTLASVSPIASCPVNYHWGTTSCVINSPTNEFTPSTQTIFKGRSAVLTWNSPLSLLGCIGTGFNTGGSNSGSVTVIPSVTTTYTLSCSNATSTTISTAQVKVIDLSIGEN